MFSPTRLCANRASLGPRPSLPTCSSRLTPANYFAKHGATLHEAGTGGRITAWLQKLNPGNFITNRSGCCQSVPGTTRWLFPWAKLLAAVVAGTAYSARPATLRRECGELIGKSFSADAGFPRGPRDIVQGGGRSGQALIDCASG